MSFETLHSNVRTRFRTEVEDTQSIVVVYDNGPDNHPDDAIWARWTVTPGASRSIEAGPSPTVRTVGVAVAKLYQPIEEGDRDLLQLVDVVVSAFRNVHDTVNGIRYRTPSVRVVGRPNDGKWWQINVVCPFQCDVAT